jgi:hypothetical protein
MALVPSYVNPNVVLKYNLLLGCQLSRLRPPLLQHILDEKLPSLQAISLPQGYLQDVLTL